MPRSLRRSLVLLLTAALLVLAGSLSPAGAEIAGGGAGRAIGGEVKVPPRPASATAATARSQVVSYSASIPAHEIWYLYVYCPAGMKVTGGGGTGYSQGYGNELRFSRALDGGDGWIVDVANTTGSALPFYVQAVCFSGLSNYSIQTRTVATTSPYPWEDARVQCSSGTLLGSGVYANSYNIQLTVLRAHYDKWVDAAMIKRGADVQSLTAQAICADGIAGYQRVVVEQASPAPGFRSYVAECPVGTTVLSPGADLAGAVLLGFSVSQRWATTWMTSQDAGWVSRYYAVCGS